jgi:hypothetical protein
MALHTSIGRCAILVGSGASRAFFLFHGATIYAQDLPKSRWLFLGAGVIQPKTLHPQLQATSLTTRRF